jgi:hypothetical protein
VEVLHLRMAKSQSMRMKWSLSVTRTLSSKIVCNGLRGVSGTTESRLHSSLFICTVTSNLTMRCERSGLYDEAAVGCNFLVTISGLEEDRPCQDADPNKATLGSFSNTVSKTGKLIRHSISAPTCVFFSHAPHLCVLT